MFQNHEKKFPPKILRFVKKYIKVNKIFMSKEFITRHKYFVQLNL